MSRRHECKHNDHGHIMLWMALAFTAMGACNDCNIDYQGLKRENADLRHRVEQLERAR